MVNEFNPYEAGAISAAGSLLNTGLSIGMANLSYKNARKMADYQYSKAIEMWNRQNEYNLPANQMQRLQSAGLNPNLVYGSGTVAGNTSSDYPTYNTPETNQYQNIRPIDVNGALQTITNIELQQSQAANLDAQTANINSRMGINQWDILMRQYETAVKAQQYAKTKVEREYWKDMCEITLKNLEQTNANLFSNTKLNDSQRFLNDAKKATEGKQQNYLDALTATENEKPSYFRSLTAKSYSDIIRNSVLNDVSYAEKELILNRSDFVAMQLEEEGYNITYKELEAISKFFKVILQYNPENPGAFNTGASFDFIKGVLLKGTKAFSDKDIEGAAMEYINERSHSRIPKRNRKLR